MFRRPVPGAEQAVPPIQPQAAAAAAVPMVWKPWIEAALEGATTAMLLALARTPMLAAAEEIAALVAAGAICWKLWMLSAAVGATTTADEATADEATADEATATA